MICNNECPFFVYGERSYEDSDPSENCKLEYFREEYIRNQECPIAEKRIAKMKELGGEKT